MSHNRIYIGQWNEKLYMGNIRVKFLILFVPLKYINRSNKELNEKLLFFFRRPKILKIEKKKTNKTKFIKEN